MHFPLYFGLLTLISLEYTVFMTTADGAIDLSRYYISAFHQKPYFHLLTFVLVSWLTF